MQIKLINIGNSKGIRLPQSLIRQYNLDKEITLEPREEGLMLRTAKIARQGWADQFKATVKPLTKDEKEWASLKNKFDEEEWTW